MIRVGGGPDLGQPGEDVEFCGLFYPDGDEISKHMAARLQSEPFYQHDKLAQALAVTKRRRGAVDCGAWVGGWSRELARHFAKVVAIEAHPDNARCAAKNTAPSGNVTVRNVALSDCNGETFIGKEANGPNVGARVGEKGIAVPLRRLDDVIAVQALDHIDYIKIHVNGMELKALRGAVGTIHQHRPVITIVLKPAITDYGDSAEAARAFLADEIRYQPAGGEKPYEIWKPR